MRGLPHSNDLDEWVRGKLRVGVTPSGWSPMIWAPMKRGPEGSEAKDRETHINLYKAL